jgi:hypothetical protein
VIRNGQCRSISSSRSYRHLGHFPRVTSLDSELSLFTPTLDRHGQFVAQLSSFCREHANEVKSVSYGDALTRINVGEVVDRELRWWDWVCQHARAESFSKHAASTSRTPQFRVRQNRRLRASHEPVDRALDHGRRYRRHVLLVLITGGTWARFHGRYHCESAPDSPALAGRRRKAPHRVPQRRGGGGLHDVARRFQSILSESGRSAAWLAHLPWATTIRLHRFHRVRRFSERFLQFGGSAFARNGTQTGSKTSRSATVSRQKKAGALRLARQVR